MIEILAIVIASVFFYWIGRASAYEKYQPLLEEAKRQADKWEMYFHALEGYGK